MNTCPCCFGLGKVSPFDVRFCYNCRGTGIHNDMNVSIIVAVDFSNVIGKDGKIPWHIPGDLKYFKELTMDKIVIMGRKTYESIESPLLGRRKIILTKKEGYMPRESDYNTISVSNSLEEAVACCYAEKHESEVFIIGGEEIYKEALERDFVDKIYMTRVHDRFDGDTYFPKLDKRWVLISSFHGGFDNGVGHSYSIYEKEKQ